MGNLMMKQTVTTVPIQNNRSTGLLSVNVYGVQYHKLAVRYPLSFSAFTKSATVH